MLIDYLDNFSNEVSLQICPFSEWVACPVLTNFPELFAYSEYRYLVCHMYCKYLLPCVTFFDQ